MNRLLFTLIFFTGLTIQAQDSIQLLIQKAISDFESYPAFTSAAITLKVVDCATGKEVGGINSNQSLMPASTTKLFSTAYAFETLGKDYTPKTRIYHDGWIGKDSTLHGNIWIRGGMDVSLGSKYYNGNGQEDFFLRGWVDSLKTKGIKKIIGSIYADGSEFGYDGAPDGWTWNDLGNYYGAGPSGITLYDNVLRYYFETGKKAGTNTRLTKTFPSLPNLTFRNSISTGGKGDNSYVYGAPFSYDRYGTGTLQAGNNHFMVRGSLPDPELQMAQEFVRILREKGIAVDSCYGQRLLGKESASSRYASKKILFTQKGRTLESVAWWTNMKSVNLFAESVMCWASFEQTGDGSVLTAAEQMANFWSKRIPSKGLYLMDGSGLSRSNAISATNFCDLLCYMNNAKTAKNFYATLAVSGISGTLDEVCKNQAAHGRVHAKSGTIKRVKSYAGYVETYSGKKLAFAILVNNFSCSSEIVIEQMEKVFNTLVLY